MILCSLTFMLKLKILKELLTLHWGWCCDDVYYLMPSIQKTISCTQSLFVCIGQNWWYNQNQKVTVVVSDGLTWSHILNFFRFWLESNHWIRAGYSEHSLTGRLFENFFWIWAEIFSQGFSLWNRKNFLIFSLFSVDCIVYVGPHISIKAFWLVPYFIY